MRRLAAATASVALILFVGCAASPAESLPEAMAPPTPVGPRVLDWGLVDCESMTWSVPVLASSLEPLLPDGFQPGGGGGPVTVGQTATIGFRAVECAQGFGQEDVVRSAQSGFLFAPVLPPAQLRDDRFATRYTFAWDAMVGNDGWRAGAIGWGLPVHDGGALVGPVAQGWRGELAMDRVGTFTVTGRTLESQRPVDDRESRTITVGSQDFALWDSSVEGLVVSTGVGLWTASPESWVAQVLGATQGTATFELATWSQPRATVHWPGHAMPPVDGDLSSPDDQAAAGLPVA